MSEAYSLQTLLRLLRFRGVYRVPREQATPTNVSVLRPVDGIVALEVYTESSSLDEESTPSHLREPFLDFPTFRLTDEAAETSANPDAYYNDQTQGGFNEDDAIAEENDDGYTFLTYGEVSDRRYSNNTERTNQEKDLYEEARAAIANDYSQWEQHDDLTRRETAHVSSVDAVHDESSDGEDRNGGVYEPYRPGLSMLSSLNPMQLLEIQPAAKFRDSLKLTGVKAEVLSGLENSRKLKNNMATVILGCDEDFLVTCCMSEILLFDFDPETHAPINQPVLRFETRPPFTSTAQRILLTWPYYPHTLNSVRSVDDWIDGGALCVASDDGSVHIWNVGTLTEQVSRLKLGSKTSEPRLYGLRIVADYTLGLESSAWGIDLASTKDDNGEQHHIVVASSNSQNVTLFYHHKQTNTFHKIVSHQLLHNIPEISVLKYLIESELHSVVVSCCSISGELVLFLFTFRLAESGETCPSDSTYPIRVGPVIFDEPRILRRTSLDSDCWTTKPISSKFFKLVQSIRAMSGDPTIDDEAEAAQILTESKIMGVEPNSMLSESLGISTAWQFFDSPVVTFATNVMGNRDDTSKFTSVDEECRRIHQAYRMKCGKTDEHHAKCLQDTFLAVSTDSRLGLFRADTLFCSAATRRVFTLELPLNEETKWCNRILITHVIPELLCFIAATQLGLVTIMRLCRHRGIYGMRQEYLFPNALSLLVAESTLRSLTGLSVRNMSLSQDRPRFFVYVLYSDGLVLTYKLESDFDEDYELYL